jgi:UDP-glucose 4-epimerase
MRVLITGAVGGMGRLLAERLLADPGVESVTGLDARVCNPPVPGMAFVRADLRQPEWTGLLLDQDAVIHLAGMGWPLPWRLRGGEQGRIEGTQALVRALGATPVARLIVVNSAALYGPQPSGPVMETAPAHGYRHGAYARARARIEDILDTMLPAYPDMAITRLRTAWPVGSNHQPLVRYFARSPVLACGLEDRRLSIVHESDLVGAIAFALRHNLTGVYNVAARAAMTFWEVAALVDQTRACVPLAWVTLRAWWRWRWRGQRTPPGWVRSLYQSEPLATARLAAAGWTPRFGPREAVGAALEAFQAGL